MIVDIWPTDHRHIDSNDNTCSRCYREIREDEVPLLLWPANDKRIMLIYCEYCFPNVIKGDPDG